MVVVFLYWILGTPFSSSPPYFFGIILAETEAPSAGSF